MHRAPLAFHTLATTYERSNTSGPHGEKMTAHELAQKLLQMEDKPVVISDDGDYNEIKAVEMTLDKVNVRLLRIE